MLKEAPDYCLKTELNCKHVLQGQGYRLGLALYYMM